ANRSIELSKAADHAFGVSHSLFAAGLTYLRQGDSRRAVAAFEQSYDITQTRTVTFLAPVVGAHLGYSLALAGRIDDALVRVEHARAEASKIGHTGMAMLAHEVLGEVYFLGDRKTDALATAREALHNAQRTRARGMEARLFRLLGDIAAAGAGTAIDAAERDYRAALDLAVELGMRPLIAHCHLGLGKLYRRT